MAATAEVLTLSAAGERKTLPVAAVAEILRLRTPTRVPLAPASLLGVINLRGTVLPVVSLATLLGRPSTGAMSSAARIVVVAGEHPVGIMVEAVSAPGPAVEGTALALDLLLERDFAASGQQGGRHATAPGDNRAGTGAETGVAGAPDTDQLVLLGFRLGTQDYALPLDRIATVTVLPPGIERVPDTDRTMIGVMEIHGRLVPLVSPHALLGLPPPPPERKAWVIVIQFGSTHDGPESRAGLVVDAMSAILRVDPAQVDAVPPIMTRFRSEARIEAICRLEGGRRLVSVLSPLRLFDAETTRRIASASGAGPVRGNDMTDDAGAAQDRTQQFVLFRLGDEQYGLPVAAVHEVLRHPGTLTRVPHAPAFIEGVMNLRGAVLPVIDQRQHFAVEGVVPATQRRIVVVMLGTLKVGFAVDSASQVADLPTATLAPAPALASGVEQHPLFDRVATRDTDGTMILLVDPAALLDQAAREVLAAIVARHDAGV